MLSTALNRDPKAADPEIGSALQDYHLITRHCISMTPERWQQIEKLLGQALEQEPVRSNLLLDSPCAGDEELRRAHESVILYQPRRS
jgi:hypothetical protein